ncbi:MAG: hypothetical protein MZV49_11430 [Rhodopseudomonas palustris]|nr:hypothetical protein [Rhodopseudomonas palustris]
MLEKARKSFKDDNNEGLKFWRYGGTANALTSSGKNGTQAVKNYSEGTFGEIEKIGAAANREASFGNAILHVSRVSLHARRAELQKVRIVLWYTMVPNTKQVLCSVLICLFQTLPDCKN